MDFAQLKDLLSKENICFVCDEPMKKHTSYRIGGNAKILSEPKTAEQIAFITQTCKDFGIPYYVIGNGSNLLVSDNGYEGVIIKISKNFSDIKISDNILTASAGALLSAAAKTAAAHSLSGLECESGIPGCIGGAVYMNAGAYGGEIKDIAKTVTYLLPNGSISSLDGANCLFGYRKSIFNTNGGIILSCKFCLEHKNEKEICEKMAELSRKRREKQPLEYPSCGSAFKRPEGYFAAALIEQAGLKGYSVGAAQVSEKHTGFIINRGGATADDIIKLTDHIKNEVFKKFGVELECEMKMIGF